MSSNFSPFSSRCSAGGGKEKTRNAKPLPALLFALTLAASGCARWAEPTAATSPAPLTPGAVVTGEWSYTYRGETFTESGEWVHLPAGEAGNLLLWIRNAEEGMR